MNIFLLSFVLLLSVTLYEVEFHEWQLAELDVQNTVSHHSLPVIYSGIFDVWNEDCMLKLPEDRGETPEKLQQGSRQLTLDSPVYLILIIVTQETFLFFSYFSPFFPLLLFISDLFYLINKTCFEKAKTIILSKQTKFNHIKQSSTFIQMEIHQNLNTNTNSRQKV